MSLITTWHFEPVSPKGKKARIAFDFGLDAKPGTLVTVRFSGPKGTATGVREKVARDGRVAFSLRSSMFPPGDYNVALEGDDGLTQTLPFAVQ